MFDKKKKYFSQLLSIYLYIYVLFFFRTFLITKKWYEKAT